MLVLLQLFMAVAVAFVHAQSKTVGNNCKVRGDYTPKSSLDVKFRAYNPNRGDLMRYRFQAGVNLGSWFVNEKWMVPSLFSCAYGKEKGELAILRGYGDSPEGIQSARSRLEAHWDTWITDEDMAQIRARGINSVRIPIGYWNLPGANFTKDTPFENFTDVYKNSWKYVRRAIKLADDHDLGVLLDLHGAYGSQNGGEISGFNKFDVNFYKGDNRQRTTDALVWIANDLNGATNLIGIELLNEPKYNRKLVPWSRETAQKIHALGGQMRHMPIYISNPYEDSDVGNYVINSDEFVVFDFHSYFAFNNKKDSEEKISAAIRGPINDLFVERQNTTRDRFVIGEWSCALDPQSLSKDRATREDQVADFCQTQIDVYRNSTAGLYFWSYKFQNCKAGGSWCYDNLHDKFFTKYNAFGIQHSRGPEAVAAVQREELPAKYRDALYSPKPDSYDLGYAEGWQFAKKTGSGIAPVAPWLPARIPETEI